MPWNFILAPIESVLTILWSWIVPQPLRLEIKVLFNFFLSPLSRSFRNTPYEDVTIFSHTLSLTYLNKKFLERAVYAS